MFRGELTRKVLSEEVVASKKHGRSLYLPEELDEKLRTFLIVQRRSGGNINRHTVYGVLMGLIKRNLHLYGGYFEFTATDGWLYSLFKRINFVRRTVTISRPVVTIVTRNGQSGNTGRLNRNLYVMLKFTERSKTPGITSTKNMTFPERNKLFAGDFCGNLDKTNADMVQLTKRWKWKWIV